jgi:hypothetical protein
MIAYWLVFFTETNFVSINKVLKKPKVILQKDLVQATNSLSKYVKNDQRKPHFNSKPFKTEPTFYEVQTAGKQISAKETYRLI